MKSTIATLALLGAATCTQAGDFADRVSAAAVGDHRSAENIARNAYRHPVETLTFFGIAKGMSVMEIWPGGGWYTEILAPAMRDFGTFTIATWDPDVEGQADYRYELPVEMQERFEARPDLYDQVQVVYYSPPGSASLGEAESQDMVLTFRNTHGWVGSGMAQDVFNEFARVLKPGGVLGVVQHRAPEGSDVETYAGTGYVPEAHVRALAANAGLEFVAASEVNANPRDTKDHEKGVWTLPPGYELGDVDREKYAAIGESDRMTLKFVKPE